MSSGVQTGFSRPVESGETSQVALASAIGATAMVIAGVVAILFAVNAEGKSFEDIARPPTAEGDEPESASKPFDSGKRPADDRVGVRQRDRTGDPRDEGSPADARAAPVGAAE